MKKKLSLCSGLKEWFAIIALTLVVPFSMEAQLLPPAKPNTFLRYACPDATTSKYTYDLIKAPKSNKICGEGTEMRVVMVTGLTLGTATVTRLDIENGEHRAQVNVTWNPPPVLGQPLENVMRVEVWYRKMAFKITKGCNFQGWTYMYTYDIHRDAKDPLGLLDGNASTTAPSNETESTFSLSYKPNAIDFLYDSKTNIVPLLKATKIRYFNGKVNIETDINKNGYVYLSTPVVYYALGINHFSLNVEVLVQPMEGCTGGGGTWYPLQTKTLIVNSSCYQDDFSAVTITPVGAGAEFHPEDGSYTINLNQDYTLTVTGITDFANHYSWNVTNGGAYITLNGNVFSVSKDIVSYRIEANANVEGCSAPEPLVVLTGGKNTFIDETCTITLPEYLAKPPYSTREDDIVLRHFTTNVKSKRSIIVMPGVSLELGAELIIEDEPDGVTNDLTLNYIEETTFDEYRRVLSASRSYVDDRGLPLQTQYKNLSSEVILANATLYDAQGRAAITTLSAPVKVAEPATCPIEDEVKTETDFTFKPDFVIADINVEGDDGDEQYNATHFDLTKENTPVAVDASREGTLGWYYSSNNGDSERPNMNEPLVATTKYPYSRRLFKHDGTGEVKGSTKPGDLFKAGSIYLDESETESVASNDIFLNEYLDIRDRDLDLIRPTIIEGQFYKTTTLSIPDADGLRKKAISYSDKGGKTIISLYYGTGTTPISKTYSFYDNADRLLVSISPNGLERYHFVDGVSNFSEIDKTQYFYDGKGRLVALEEKIAGQELNGISRREYVYRSDGNIRFSQNHEQRKAIPQRYSYTNYDRSGRPFESGEYVLKTAGIMFNSLEMKAILENKNEDGGLTDEGGTKRERTFTYYDEPDPNLPTSLGRTQHFVHGAVSFTKKDDIITTWYSYDEQGRAEWSVQDIAGLGMKTMDYRYGPTGQLQDVIYQKGNDKEQFTHYYEYDADGRMKKVYTTRELLVYNELGKLTNKGTTYYEGKREINSPGVLEHQATYYYYLHGPLKRIELATNASSGSLKTLQGIDYTYTVDGALKSINHADKTMDPGHDGTGTHATISPDVFGMTLEYYANDYSSAKDGIESISIPGDYKDQYNGLIKAARWHGPTEPNKQFGYGYQYDQRNQFKKADWGTVEANLFTSTPSKPYHESIGGYDANGNIVSLQRNANLFEPADFFNYNLTYSYKANTNMLTSITNTQGQNVETFRSYNYNDLGQTTAETEGNKTKFITYDVTGKVVGVYNNAVHTQPIVTFVYDNNGFRLSKTTYDENHEALFRTWYVRNASGNVMSTYEQDAITSEVSEQPIEMPVYGSGRLGLYKPDYGFTFYELTDHLGNVRAVIGDKPDETEYRATMETERDSYEENPVDRVGFYNRKPITSATYNHTPNQLEIDDETFTFEAPSKVIRINNLPNGEPPVEKEPIGAGIVLSVHPGDVLKADVFVKYADFSSTNNNIITNLAPFLTTAFGASVIIDGVSIFDASNIGDINVLPAKTGTLNESRPRAFLTYILFDKNNKVQAYDFVQVSEDAEIPELDPQLHLHEHLILDNIKIEKEGYLYVYVSNQSDQDMEVYFDDLGVTQNYSNIAAGSDFYPFGLPIKDREITRENYRHGYQGQFAEKDEETGRNHFELRDYDPVIGRWSSIDPFYQFWSPYIGMGNNPVSIVDPDGGVGGPAWKDPEPPRSSPEMIIMSHYVNGSLLDNVVVEDRKYSYVENVLWVYAQTYEPELYLNVLFKQSKSSGKGKVTIPIAGISGNLTKEGFGWDAITPSSSYVSYKVDGLEYRVYPAEGKNARGEDGSVRILVLVHQTGIFKTQADFTAKKNGDMMVGGRVVMEWEVTRGGTSVEVSLGFRTKVVRPFLFTLLPGFGRKH